MKQLMSTINETIDATTDVDEITDDTIDGLTVIKQKQRNTN